MSPDAPRPADVPAGRSGRAPGGRVTRRVAGAEQPCLRCGAPLSPRVAGCKGGQCPNCGHPYPHGDCSD